MTARGTERGGGDTDYGRVGAGYARQRRADPRIAAAVVAALGDARTVLNVGAGAGSYEPRDRRVAAVEPSATMRAQRPPELTRAIDAVAEALPFADAAFDAALAVFTVHQWADAARGLAELRRVTTGPVVVVSCDPGRVERYWLAGYAPEVLAAEAGRYPTPDELARHLGPVTVTPVPVPFDCTDGFVEAFYGRPEALLDPEVRRAQSAWTVVDAGTAARSVAALRRDLESGAWDARHGHLRAQGAYDGALRLFVAGPR